MSLSSQLFDNKDCFANYIKGIFHKLNELDLKFQSFDQNLSCYKKVCVGEWVLNGIFFPPTISEYLELKKMPLSERKQV